MAEAPHAADAAEMLLKFHTYIFLPFFWHHHTETICHIMHTFSLNFWSANQTVSAIDLILLSSFWSCSYIVLPDTNGRTASVLT